jgi:hypothetical protein
MVVSTSPICFASSNCREGVGFSEKLLWVAPPDATIWTGHVLGLAVCLWSSVMKPQVRSRARLPRLIISVSRLLHWKKVKAHDLLRAAHSVVQPFTVINQMSRVLKGSNKVILTVPSIMRNLIYRNDCTLRSSPKASARYCTWWCGPDPPLMPKLDPEFTWNPLESRQDGLHCCVSSNHQPSRLCRCA